VQTIKQNQWLVFCKMVTSVKGSMPEQSPQYKAVHTKVKGFNKGGHTTIANAACIHLQDPQYEKMSTTT
jgi:hypothetical protein